VQTQSITPMRDDIPLDEHSIELARQAQADERAEATRQTGIRFSEDGKPYVPKVIPFPESGTQPDQDHAETWADVGARLSPAETQQQHVDASFQAPSAGQRLFHLQAIESTQAAAVAEDLAFRFYGCKLAELTTEDRVTVQYTAVGAVRALSECWRREARRASVAAIERAMKEEMGPVFASMPWEARRKLAEIAETEARVASIGVLTGASRMAPGTYLRIVTGEQR
jgi:hypothetical protein